MITRGNTSTAGKHKLKRSGGRRLPENSQPRSHRESTGLGSSSGEMAAMIEKLKENRILMQENQKKMMQQYEEMKAQQQKYEAEKKEAEKEKKEAAAHMRKLQEHLVHMQQENLEIQRENQRKREEENRQLRKLKEEYQRKMEENARREEKRLAEAQKNENRRRQNKKEEREQRQRDEQSVQNLIDKCEKNVKSSAKLLKVQIEAYLQTTLPSSYLKFINSKIFYLETRIKHIKNIEDRRHLQTTLDLLKAQKRAFQSRATAI